MSQPLVNWEAKRGWRIRCIQHRDGFITKGKIYEVRGLDEDGWPIVLRDNGRWRYMPPDMFTRVKRGIQPNGERL